MDYDSNALDSMLEENSYEALSMDDGLYLEKDRTRVKVLTRSGNLSSEFSVIGQELYDLEFQYGLRKQIEGKERLVEKSIMDEDGDVSDPEIRDFAESFLSEWEQEQVFAGFEEISEELESELASDLKDVDKDVADARYLAEELDRSKRAVGKVLGYWGREHSLDDRSYRIGSSTKRVKWNLRLLREEVLSDF